MTIVITCQIEYDRTGKRQTIADYGIDPDTGTKVVLPSEPPASLGARLDDKIGEWVIA